MGAKKFHCLYDTYQQIMVTTVNQMVSTKTIIFNMELNNETNNNLIDDISLGRQVRSSSSSLSKRPSAGSKTSENSSKSELTSSDKWLLAHRDSQASLYTHSSCICFTDLQGDGDFQLIIAHLGNGKKGIELNIYKGTFVLAHLTLIDCPAGVVSFYMDTTEPKIPAIGVASGSFLYVYKNLKPFYKFGVPCLDIDQTELQAWLQAKEDEIDLLTLKELLMSVRNSIGEANMTARSQAFLDLNEPDEMEQFVNQHKNLELKRQAIITCITTIKKTLAEDNNLNCLIIGTENRDIFIIEPDAFTILASVQLQSIPVFIEVNGLLDVEYRLIVSCRDGHIYTIKRGYKSGRLCVQLNSQPVGLVRSNNSIIVACMDSTLACYTVNGNCIWRIQTPASITALAAVDIETLNLSLVAVALENRQIHFYNNKIVADIIETDDVITSIKFGRYGREDNTLIMVSRSGFLIVQILKRTAKFTFNQNESKSIVKLATGTKLNIPKKTKLFVDLSMREREDYLAIHRTFQHDLYRLNLTTARSYAKAITSSLNPISTNYTDPLKLSAQVHGLGPIFKLVLELQNISLDQPSVNLFITFQCNIKIYQIERNYIPVSYLCPGCVYTFSTKVECVAQVNVSDYIKVHILRENETGPLITAVISMPSSEAVL